MNCVNRPRMGGAPKKESDKRTKSSMEDHMNREADAGQAAGEAVPSAFFGQKKARKVYACSHCGQPGASKAQVLGVRQVGGNGWKGGKDKSRLAT